MTGNAISGPVMTGRDKTANRVKPPLPGMAGGILGTAFVRGARIAALPAAP